MRGLKDRLRHAVLFELVGLTIFIPLATLLFNQPLGHMSVIGVFSSVTATVWNFVYNLTFDRTLLRLTGSTEKTLRMRLLHTALFEVGFVLVLIPFIAWYLNISFMAALLMDMAIVAFYLVYAFLFNLTYDRLFPIAAKEVQAA